MNVNNSIKKNLSLQTAYQILNTILPLITTPYLSRVLGVEQLGIFSYASSVVSYFTIVAMLGTENYGTRSISMVKDDREARSKTFSSIFTLQMLVSLIALAGYFIYFFFFCRDNKLIALIQGLAIISCFFDINWLFFGVEDFKLTVSRSIVIRILTVASIILFVNKEKDLWLYTLLMLGGTLISQLILWFRVKKYVDFAIPSKKSVVEHIKPNLVLFIPLLAMSVYHAMDKTMLGALSTYRESGLYYYSDRVVNIPLCILSGVGTVMLPRMTALYSKKQFDEANKLFLLSMDGISFLGVAMCFGISAIANDFIPFFFGPGYDECIPLTIVLSVVIIIKGVSNAVRTQYLVPLKHEKILVQSVVAGALVNLFVNMILIPRFGALGAVLGTIIAEFVACAWQIVFIKKKFKTIKLSLNSLAYIIFGLCMFYVVKLFSVLQMPTVLKLLLDVVVGGVFYIIVSILFWFITKNTFINVIFRRNNK